MQIIPTIEIRANTEGDCIVINVQKDVELRLTVAQAMSLGHHAIFEAEAAMKAARFVEMDPAQLIAFPSPKVCRAIAADRAAGRA